MTGKTVSHYRILEKLGGGGMGVVYKAQDLKLDRFVALKFLPPHLSESADEKQRFIQEAKAASALDHPNICTIHEIGETDDGQMFIVMAYYAGETLKTKIAPGALKLNEALDLAIQIAQGLAKAHEKGILHRDIKPTNVMVTKDGVAKIVDFGLAKLAGQAKLTKADTCLGTLPYMSPEQVQGAEVDTGSDIFSLGVVIYEMLTGELPLKADYDAAWMYAIVNQQPLVPSALDRRIPLQVDTAVMKALEKDRARRYQGMQELIKSLQDIRAELEAASQAVKTKAIAVLPFDNISPDTESDYFSDGLTEELIVNLSRLKDVRVVSRTTSMQYKGAKKDIKTIGRELGVRYIMEGSVRRFQDNLRITAQLIDVESDAQLWAETYKGKLADVFDIQEQVSKQIVDALMLKLTPTEKVVLTKRSTLNAEAFDCNLRARDFLYRLSKNNIQFAIQLFQRAIELDQRYAEAHAGLGEAYAYLYQVFDRNNLWLESAIEASLKALMYDSTLSEAYAALGLCYFNKNEPEEALTASQKAIELDPGNFIGYWILGRIYHRTDRTTEAVEMFKKVVELRPDFYSVYNDLLMVYRRLGEKEKYAETLHIALEVYPRYLSQHPDDARGHMHLAALLAQVGKIENAKIEGNRALELSPGDPLIVYNAACFYAQMGEKGLALEALKNAVAAGYVDYEWIKRDTELESLRQEPEYIELMKGK